MNVFLFRQIIINILIVQFTLSPTVALASTSTPSSSPTPIPTSASASSSSSSSAAEVIAVSSLANQSVSATVTESMPRFTNQGDLNLLAENMATISAEEKQNLTPLLDLADRLDSSSLMQAKIPINDFHLLGQQYIEYLREGKVIRQVSLQDVKMSLPAVAYTRLNIKVDYEHKQLIFEGTRGENENGQNGEVVVRQVISGVDIKAITPIKGNKQDKELIVYIDSKGKLNAINFQFVKAAIFKSAIPVFTNLWSPLQSLDLTQKNVFVEFRQRNSTPLNFAELPKSTVLAYNEKGEVIWNAGDVVAGYEESPGKIKYLGIFNRAMIAEDIYNISKFAFTVGSLSQNNEQLAKDLPEILEKQNENENEKRQESAKEKYQKYVLEMSPLERKALAALSPEALGSLKLTGAFVNAQSNRQKDQFTQTENIQWAQKALADLQSKYVAGGIPQTPAQAEVVDTSSKLDSGNKKELGPLYNPTRASVLLNSSAKFLGQWYTMTFLGVGYLSFPLMYDHFEVLQQMKILSWTYHHLYTDVMKDASYRIVNIRSMIKLLLIIPGAMLTSASVGWLLKGAAKVSQNSNSLAAQRIRDLALVWGDMGVWQRIVTFSNRYYSVWVYPILRVVFSHTMRQKGLFSGLEMGFANPLEKIKADSQVGRELGLNKDEYVLWNNPLDASISLAKYLEPLGIRISPKLYQATDAKANAVAERKQNIQLALKAQKDRYKKLAWVFAALVVSEKTGVDPATLVYAADQGESILNLDAIFKNPEQARKFELISQGLYQAFHEIDVLKGNLKDNLDPVEVEEFVKKAREIAEKIYQSKSSERLARLKMKFRQVGLSVAKGTAQYGMTEVNILRNSIPNTEIFSMVQREFTLDHIQVATVPAMVGDRADLMHPQELTAQQGAFLDTNPKHMYDMAYNTYVHLLLAGAKNTLTYYKYSPEREDVYDPIEYQQYAIKERSESLMKSTFQFARHLLPDKSDIGGVILSDLKRQLTTIQSRIYSAIFLRGLAYGTPPAIVAHAFGFEFFSMIVWWGWIWYPMQLGTQLTSARVKNIKLEMQQMHLKISRALRGLDGEQSESRLRQAYGELLNSYRRNAPEMLQKVLVMTDVRNVKNLEHMNATSLPSNDTRIETEAMNDLQSSQQKWMKATSNADSELQVAQEYFGLLIKLAYAQKNNETTEVGKIKKQIVQIMSGELSAEEMKELKKLSAESLLEFSLEHPPKASMAHPMVPWLATQTAVFVSTYLATSWSVVILNPDLLMDPSLIPRWMGYWAAAYTSAYVFLRKSSYDRMVESYKQFQERIVNSDFVQRAMIKVSSIIGKGNKYETTTKDMPTKLGQSSLASEASFFKGKNPALSCQRIYTR